jgi:hypothetical protein
MKAKRNSILVAVLALICLGASGCAGSAAARLTAIRLRSAVVQDEKLVDNNIAQQKQFYKEQSTLIENARAANIQFNVDSFRRARSARIATTMSLDPNKEARLSNLMDSLLETHDQEFQLWQKLYGGDQQAREELQSKIASLERQKKLLTQVKDNLNQLALASSSKKQAQMLLKFSQDTYAAYKKASK